jgi:phosphomannomutase/phosphoglucomutase
MSAWNPAIFREYDIRGIAGRDLTPAFAERLGRAYGTLVPPKPDGSAPRIAVGRDCRLSSDSLTDALVRGLVASGLDVVRIGVCPTPLTLFTVFTRDLDGGIMVTGSHNPADYNGFKITVGRDTLHGESIQDIRRRMDEPVPSPAKRAGSVSDFDPIPPYLDYVAKHARPLRRKKIVIDAGNGTAGKVAPALFRKLGAEVVELFCDLDGRFPNHHPDPTVPKNLVDLVASVRAEKADFGVAFDGDSDRIGLVDEQGSILFGDEILILFARDVLRATPGATVIGDVKCTYRLYQDIAARGGRGIMWRTGHSVIKSKMKEERAPLAGELSGHIFFADRWFGFDDAIYAASRAYEIACAAHGPFSSILSDLEKTVSTPELRVDCEESRKFELVAGTLARLRACGQGTVNDRDGVRLDFADGWGLVRASNTQPALTLRFEAKTEARLAGIRALVERELLAAANAIGHPPLHLPDQE